MALEALKKPASKNFTIKRGDSFSRTFTIKVNGAVFNLTGWTVAAQVRLYPDGDLKADFDATVLVPATDGQIRMRLTKSQTGGFPTGDLRYDVEIELTADAENNHHTILEGSIALSGDVSGQC